MKHTRHRPVPPLKVGQRYMLPSGNIGIVKHIKGEAEVGFEYENRRYKGRAEEVTLTMSNVKNICTFLSDVVTLKVGDGF